MNFQLKLDFCSSREVNVLGLEKGNLHAICSLATQKEEASTLSNWSFVDKAYEELVQIF
jgi:hypothetical protein